MGRKHLLTQAHTVVNTERVSSYSSNVIYPLPVVQSLRYIYPPFYEYTAAAAAVQAHSLIRNSYFGYVDYQVLLYSSIKK